MSDTAKQYVVLEVKKANPEWFSENGKLRMGILYFLRGSKGGILQKPFVTSQYTNLPELRQFFRQEDVYMLECPWEEIDVKQLINSNKNE